MKYLIVIDMQNDFIDGSLGTKEAVAIVENVAKKIDECRKQGYKIIFTHDTHDNNYENTQEGKKLPVPHCIINTFGWEISKQLPIESDDLIFDKPTFGSVKLAEFLSKEEQVEYIELIGLCTDICVISNAMLIKASLPEVPVCVDANCCAGVTPQSHNNALEAMKMCQIETIE